MADLLIPDSRFESPGLFYKRRKPVGKVQVDKSNSLSNDLIDILMYNGQKTLVQGLANISTTLPNNYADFSRFEGNNQHLNYGVGDGNYDEIQKFSITCFFTVRSVTSDGNILEKISGTNNGWMLFMDNLGTHGNNIIEFFVSATSSNYHKSGSSVAHESGTFIVTATFDGTASDLDRARIYVNNVEETDGFKNGSGCTDIGGTSYSLTSGAHQTNIDREFDGDIYFSMMHSRVLSRREISEIYRDPYGILIPA